MHEFALAQDIIETISRTIGTDLNKLTAIFIDVGEFSGVVKDSLEFGLTVCLKDKRLENVKINMEMIPASAICECGFDYPLKDILDTCPKCFSLNRKISSGTDVIIRSLELSD